MCRLTVGCVCQPDVPVTENRRELLAQRDHVGNPAIEKLLGCWVTQLLGSPATEQPSNPATLFRRKASIAVGHAPPGEGAASLVIADGIRADAAGARHIAGRKFVIHYCRKDKLWNQFQS